MSQQGSITEPTKCQEILILGDGDFSFSVDLARFLAHKIEQSYDASATGTDDADNSQERTSIHLTATGIDSRDEVLSKYKDSPHLLKALESSEITFASSGQNDGQLSISVLHRVNAAQADENDGNNPTMQPADHVVFNHPHLGTEDAALYSSFLCHLFHAATKRFMTPVGSLYHLTLVKGQFERWKCAKAAEKRGLELLSRNPFRLPPLDSIGLDNDTSKKTHSNYYQYRRHQTGKSFESRRSPGGSETFTFCRKSDRSLWNLSTSDHRESLIPWYSKNDQSRKDVLLAEAVSLKCPFCDKTFREERSRKCHIKDIHSKHDAAPTVNRKRGHVQIVSDGSESTFYACKWGCTGASTGQPRTFVSEQALDDHRKAKHSALHADIKPDWFKGTSSRQLDGQSAPSNHTNEIHDSCGCCEVCEIMFASQDDASRHARQFIPPPTTGDLSSESSLAAGSFSCSFCSKSFRELRAKLQHENFCSAQS